MSISPPITTPIFEGMLLSASMTGVHTPQLALGLSTGLYQYMQVGCKVTSVNIGTLGAGLSLGAGLVVTPTVLSPLMISTFAANGMIGIMSPPLATAISLGICTSLASSILAGPSVGVGLGAGKVQCIPTGTGAVLFAAGFAAAGILGPHAVTLATAISLALDTVIATAIGVVAVTGPPNIIPGVGSSILTVN